METLRVWFDKVAKWFKDGIESVKRPFPQWGRGFKEKAASLWGTIKEWVFPRLGKIKKKTIQIFVATREKFPAAIKSIWRWLELIRQNWLIVGGLTAFFVLLFLLFSAWRCCPGSESQTAMLEFARILVQGVGVVGIIYGAIYSFRRFHALEKQVAVSERGQVTDRFTKAMDLLSAVQKNDEGREEAKIEARLGGIYALASISRDYPAEYGHQVAEILNAYVQMSKTGKSPDRNGESGQEGPKNQNTREDYRTAGRVLKTLLEECVKKSIHLDNIELPGVYLETASLMGAHFEAVHLEGAHLERVRLIGAHLTGAHLEGTHFEGAYLLRAHLEGANLVEAYLEEAYLHRADLTGTLLINANLKKAILKGACLKDALLYRAYLEEADLEEANFEGVYLEEAYLKNTNLSQVLNLTSEQVAQAHGNERTKLPEGIDRPSHWPPYSEPD